MDWFDSIFLLPYSSLFILFVNICIVLIGSFIFRLMINVDRLEAQEFEVRSHDKRLKEAKRRNDSATLRKLKREGVRIKRLSISASKQRLKVIIITIMPFSAISLFLNMLYLRKEVAIFPFEFSFFKAYSFIVWHFLTYITAYLPLSKIFRSSPSLWQDFRGEV